jgi:3-dehydroquinate synthetase
VAARQERLLARFGLPTRARGVAAEAVREAMALDKKAAAGRLTWILPTALGQVTIQRGVPEAVVARALSRVLLPD